MKILNNEIKKEKVISKVIDVILLIEYANLVSELENVNESVIYHQK